MGDRTHMVIRIAAQDLEAAGEALAEFRDRGDYAVEKLDEETRELEFDQADAMGSAERELLREAGVPHIGWHQQGIQFDPMMFAFREGEEAECPMHEGEPAGAVEFVGGKARLIFQAWEHAQAYFEARLAVETFFAERAAGNAGRVVVPKRTRKD